MMPQPTPSVSRWQDVYPVHPCADVFPMMSDAEIDELAADIKAHGLQQAVVLWKAPTGRAKPATYFVLDGRNRLEALAHLGIKIPEPDYVREMIDLRGGQLVCVFQVVNDREHWESPQVEDPAEFVIGANIRRRHLTKEQQAELILKTIEAGRIDCAEVARSFNPKPGKKGGSTKDPTLEKGVAEAKKHGISRRTVQNARAKMQGKMPAPRSKKPPQTPTTTDISTATAVTTADISTATTATTAGVSPSTTATTTDISSSKTPTTTGIQAAADDFQQFIFLFIMEAEKRLNAIVAELARYGDGDRQVYAGRLKDAHDRLDGLATRFDTARDALKALMGTKTKTAK